MPVKKEVVEPSAQLVQEIEKIEEYISSVKGTFYPGDFKDNLSSEDKGGFYYCDGRHTDDVAGMTDNQKERLAEIVGYPGRLPIFNPHFLRYTHIYLGD